MFLLKLSFSLWNVFLKRIQLVGFFNKSSIDAVAIVEVEDIYLYYYKKDLAFEYAKIDSRANIISKDEVKIKWHCNEVNVEDAYLLRGMGLFSLASMHYWRHGINFDYLDIGANVGLNAIGQAIFYKRCGKMNNLVYAFEPGKIFELLDKSRLLNNVDDILCCKNIALSNTTGQIDFFITPLQTPASSMLTSAVKRPNILEIERISVPAITMDRFIDENLLPKRGLLAKIDTEGADFLVLEGAQDQFLKRHFTFQIEFFPSLVDSYINPEIALKKISEFYLINTGNDILFKIDATSHGIANFTSWVRSLHMPATDIFCIPKSLPFAEDLVERILNN